MATLVKKFGGSSVSTPENIHNVVDRVLHEKKPEDKIVIVVSAMGDSTDELLDLAQRVTTEMPKREMDVLLATGEQVSIALVAAAFCSKGHPAVSLTGFQAGIRTSDFHTKATITNVFAERVIRELANGKIVIVAGFQGLDQNGDITTLGRGGSDTTAVAIAAGINADYCEIYTDVDGVYSADPRIVAEAQKMQEITFGEMLELARLGAGVMQPRAVEYGEHNGVAIHVRSSFHEELGTIIREEYTVQEKNFVIRGVAHDTNVAKIAVKGVPDQPGIAYKLFSALANANVDVDMIIQSVRDIEGSIDILFTVTKTDLVEATSIVELLKEEMGGFTFDVGINVAKVSIVGAGMLGSPGIAAGMFGALADAKINIAAISTSEISVSCLIKESDVKAAVNAIHTHFFPK
ncbi:MAG TPA: aspartate kinase [Candidatus Avacidaminococcus intestinavium]|uniref:Aspartokinase n=1 Tax=Candidatus Avacidaminococcus intestinavium TaxID=2840684 RepID=A0A9D1MPS7_9FIRM|nr:aspartate kinase [Candidatus Avacidaminococcus intestinavium]